MIKTVNINTATLQELTALKGVAKKTAAKIIADRQQAGPFTSPEDLGRVNGVSARVVAMNLNLITVTTVKDGEVLPLLMAEPEPVYQRWLDQIMNLPTHTERRALLQSWFDKFDQLKPLYEEMKDIKHAENIYQREWGALQARLKKKSSWFDKEETHKELQELILLQSDLKAKKQDCRDEIDNLKKGLPTKKIAIMLSQACKTWLNYEVKETFISKTKYLGETQAPDLTIVSPRLTMDKIEEYLRFVDKNIVAAMKIPLPAYMALYDNVKAEKLYAYAQKRLPQLRRELERSARSKLMGEAVKTAYSFNDAQMKINNIFMRLKLERSRIQRGQWTHKVASSIGQMKRTINLLENFQEDRFELLDEYFDRLSEEAFERALEDASRGRESYSNVSQLSMSFDEVPHFDKSEYLVTFNDATSGRQASAISAISQALMDLGQIDSPLTEEVRAWEFKREGVSADHKDSQQVWQAVAIICGTYGMVPVANNGSRMLLQLNAKDGKLSGIGKLGNSLFETMSDISAYFLSLINSPIVGVIGNNAHEPLQDFRDESGRRIAVVVYDSIATGIVPGADGSAINSIGITAQIRAWSASLKREQGFFSKGLAVDARITLLDGNIWTPRNIRNLKHLQDADLGEYAPFKDEIRSFKKGSEISPELQALMDRKGDFLSNARSTAKLEEARCERWDQWFTDHPELPYFYGIELGQVKGRGKGCMSKYLNLSEYTLLVKKDGDKEISRYILKGKPIPEGWTVKEGSCHPKIGGMLQAHGGWFEVPADTGFYAWMMIEAPEKSSTSLNFQPQAVMRVLESLPSSAYRQRLADFLSRFKRESFDPGQLSKLDQILSHMVGNRVRCQYPGALLKAPESAMWRFATNLEKSSCPTRRILMTNIGFSGLTIVENDSPMLRKGPKAIAAWRSPLIVPSAIQAPVAVNATWLGRLIDCLNGNKKWADQLKVVVDRLEFRQNKSFTKQELLDLFTQMLELSSLVKVGKEIIIMNVTDVEDMQGDDDGDTVTVDFDETFVAQCQATEEFWKEFYRVNNLDPIKIEMAKANQIQSDMANKCYLDNHEPTEEEQAFIDRFGVCCPAIARKLGFKTDNIPSPLGLSFKQLHWLNRKTGGMLFNNPEAFWPIAFKLGSTPTGPIGAGSNCAPDLLIRALAQTDANLKLNEHGRRLWQGYSALASTVQVSIDWAKRVYDILCLIMYDLMTKDGSWVMDFGQEITPERAKEYLVKNTFDEVVLATFKLCWSDGKTIRTLGDKTIRIVISDDSRFESVFDQFESPGHFVYMSDTTKIYRVANQQELDTLKSGFDKQIAIDSMHYIQGDEAGEGPRFTHVRLMDPTNACFDFNSVYACASFMIQPPIRGGFTWEDKYYTSQQAAAWKPSKKEGIYKKLLEYRVVDGERKLARNPARAYRALAESDRGSALVHNVLHFLDAYIEEPDSSISEILEYPQKVVEAVKETSAGVGLDPFWNQVYARVGKYFKETYKSAGRGGEVSKKKIIKELFESLKLNQETMNAMLADPLKYASLPLDEDNHIEFNILDLVAFLWRNDPSLGDPSVPQGLGQMLIALILDETTENPFDTLGAELENQVRSKFWERFAPFNERNGEVTRSPLVNMNKYVAARRFSDVIKPYMLEVEKTGAKGETYISRRWKSAQDGFLALASQLDEDIQTVLASSGFKACALAMLRHHLESSTDVLSTVKQFGAAIKSALAVCTATARQIRAFADMQSFPTDVFVNTRIAFKTDKKTNIPLEEFNPINIFKGLDLSVDRIAYTLMRRDILPDAQYSRDLQQKAIVELGRSNYLIKSYSFFNNSGIKTPEVLSYMDALTRCINPPPGVGLDFRNSNFPGFDKRRRGWNFLLIQYLGRPYSTAQRFFTADKRSPVANWNKGLVRLEYQANRHMPLVMLSSDRLARSLSEYQGLLAAWLNFKLIPANRGKILNQLQDSQGNIVQSPIQETVLGGNKRAWDFRGKRYYSLTKLRADILKGFKVR